MVQPGTLRQCTLVPWQLHTTIFQPYIEIDQNRYCMSIVKKYLDTAGCARNMGHHDMPLPSMFVLTTDDCSKTEEQANQLFMEFNIDFASCMGSLISEYDEGAYCICS